jgi:hypothetical protein
MLIAILLIIVIILVIVAIFKPSLLLVIIPLISILVVCVIKGDVENMDVEPGWQGYVRESDLDELQHIGEVKDNIRTINTCSKDTTDPTDIKPQYPNDRDYIYSIADDDYNKYKENPELTFDQIADNDIDFGLDRTDADSTNVYLVKSMNRDKRKMDAARSKTSDFYKYNFDDELEDAEDRVWWGNYDV